MKQRIITAIVALAVFVPIVLIGGLPFTLIMYVIGTVGVIELLKMKHLKAMSFPSIISLLLTWVFLLPNGRDVAFQFLSEHKIEVALAAVLLLLMYTVIVKNKFTFDDVGFILLTTVYVGFGFHYFIEVRQEFGLAYLFFAFLIIGRRIPELILLDEQWGNESYGRKSVPIKQLKVLLVASYALL